MKQFGFKNLNHAFEYDVFTANFANRMYHNQPFHKEEPAVKWNNNKPLQHCWKQTKENFNNKIQTKCLNIHDKKTP